LRGRGQVVALNVADFVLDDGQEAFDFQPNIGVGLKIKSVVIDYALTNIGSTGVALYSNVFSLRFDLFKHKDT